MFFSKKASTQLVQTPKAKLVLVNTLEPLAKATPQGVVAQAQVNDEELQTYVKLAEEVGLIEGPVDGSHLRRA